MEKGVKVTSLQLRSRVLCFESKKIAYAFEIFAGI
jgi:hypothetical protein